VSKPSADLKRETTIVPIVTAEEVPILNEQERTALLESLKQAEAEIAAGKSKPFDREEFRKRFLAICRGDIA
jgi:hypothetical protein